MHCESEHYEVHKKNDDCWGKHTDVERQTMKKTAEKVK